MTNRWSYAPWVYCYEYGWYKHSQRVKRVGIFKSINVRDTKYHFYCNYNAISTTQITAVKQKSNMQRWQITKFKSSVLTSKAPIMMTWRTVEQHRTSRVEWKVAITTPFDKVYRFNNVCRNPQHVLHGGTLCSYWCIKNYQNVVVSYLQLELKPATSLQAKWAGTWKQCC